MATGHNGHAAALVFAAVVVLLSMIPSASAAVYSGSISSKSGVIYLGKFCYGYTPTGGGAAGKWEGTVTTSDKGAVLALFDDQSGSWPAATASGCDCHCAAAAARESYPLAAAVNTFPAKDLYEHIRDRYWYAAIVSCSSVSATYSITFEQADGSQVGMNDQGLFALYLVFFFVWGIGLGAQLWASRWLWKARTFHPIVKLFCLAVAFWFLAFTCRMIHWAVYGGNGVGVPFLMGLGSILEVFARVTFLLLVMLIATGWTISFQQLENRLQLLISIGLVLVAYLILAIWDLAGRNDASTTFVYDSAVGVVICVLHVGLLAWFVWRIRKTSSEEVHTDKLKFYRYFGILYGMWFFLLPVVVIVGAIADPWVRRKLVETVLTLLDTVAVGVLGYLLWPSRASHYFEIQTDHFVGSTQQYEDL